MAALTDTGTVLRVVFDSLLHAARAVTCCIIAAVSTAAIAAGIALWSISLCGEENGAAEEVDGAAGRGKGSRWKGG